MMINYFYLKMDENRTNPHVVRNAVPDRNKDAAFKARREREERRERLYADRHLDRGAMLASRDTHKSDRGQH